MGNAEEVKLKEKNDQVSTLLFVDDEENILSSLRRLFRPEGYRLLTATSGAEGLSLFEQEPIDLVISDMRMPEMSGAQFLEQVAKLWPDTVRILLTGHADINMTIDAINNGHIYRYISKPWEENDIKLSVQHALAQKYLERERKRLEELTQKQNEELRELNASLEAKVKARTAELQQMYDMLELTYNELKRSYVNSIPVFAGLVEMGEGNAQGHSKRVGELAREVAVEMGLDEGEAENVYFAGLLHDIGELGLPDDLLDRPYVELTTQDRLHFEKHPAMGEAALMALEPLQGAAKLIRGHHERYDGKGFPDQLYGETIPLGARILTVVNDFDALQLGKLMSERLTIAEARGFLQSNRNHRYDPTVVDAFMSVLARKSDDVAHFDELKFTSDDLRDGMVLSRDLHSDDGILLLTKGYKLSKQVIKKIKGFERDEDKGLTIHVQARSVS